MARLQLAARAWHDVLDWVGGYLSEVARPEGIFDVLRTRRWTFLGWSRAPVDLALTSLFLIALLQTQKSRESGTLFRADLILWKSGGIS